MNDISGLDAVFEQIRSEGYCCPSQCDDLRRAAEPLREYLKTRGDPHSCVVVTQDSVTEMQDERRVMFGGEKTPAD